MFKEQEIVANRFGITGNPTEPVGGKREDRCVSERRDGESVCFGVECVKDSAGQVRQRDRRWGGTGERRVSLPRAAARGLCCTLLASGLSTESRVEGRLQRNWEHSRKRTSYENETQRNKNHTLQGQCAAFTGVYYHKVE